MRHIVHWFAGFTDGGALNACGIWARTRPQNFTHTRRRVTCRRCLRTLARGKS